MIVTINLVTLILCIAICPIIYRNFIAKPANEQKRFELFAIRDRLSLIAMQGIVNENSEEYKFLMDNINATIWLYDTDFRIVDFFKVLITPQLEQTEKIKAMLKKIEKNKDLQPVFLDFFVYIHNLIHRETKLLAITATCISVCVKILQKSKQISFSQNAITNSRSQLNQYENTILHPAIHNLKTSTC